MKEKEGETSLYFKLTKIKEKKQSGPRGRTVGMDRNAEHGLAVERWKWFETTKTTTIIHHPPIGPLTVGNELQVQYTLSQTETKNCDGE